MILICASFWTDRSVFFDPLYERKNFQIACIKVGNKIFCLDTAEPDRFNFIEEAKCEAIWLDQGN